MELHNHGKQLVLCRCLKEQECPQGQWFWWEADHAGAGAGPETAEAPVIVYRSYLVEAAVVS